MEKKRLVLLCGLSILLAVVAVCVTRAFMARRGTDISARGAEPADDCFKNLPPGYSITKSSVVSRDETKAIGARLGTPILKLSNTLLVVQGTSIQVNILDVRTEADAIQLHKTLSAMHRHPAFCFRIGKRVVEYAKNNDPALATKVSYELGFL